MAIQVFTYKSKEIDIPDMGLLSADELTRLQSFKNDERYYQFIWTRHHLKTLISDTLNKSINDIDILISETGKPYLNNNPIYFSVAHKDNDIAICLHDEPCGVDIEHLEQDLNHERLAKKMLSDNERALYEKAKNKLEQFLIFWTIKESITKLEGKTLLAFSKQLRLKSIKENKAYYENINTKQVYKCYVQKKNSSIISHCSLSI